MAIAVEFENARASTAYPPSSLNLREHRTRRDSGRSDTRLLFLVLITSKNKIKITFLADPPLEI